MSCRTVINHEYKGLVEAFSIPADVHERDGKKYATFGSVVPIHSCTSEEVAKRAKSTHHYCDIFTEDIFAPLGEFAYVRLDKNLAEKVFINRNKSLLILSSDGELAQWRCAPSFESNNQYISGTPLVNKDGKLVSVITAKRGKDYAVSCFQGEGGYFGTSEPWKILSTEEGDIVYGDQKFTSREELREYVSHLLPAVVGPDSPTVPVLIRGHHNRLALVARNGRQLSHHYLHGVITLGIDYL